MQAPQIIKDLVYKFKQNLEQYKSNQYKETETRVHFLNPFWEALGWDIQNRAGKSLEDCDVVHEDSIKTEARDQDLIMRAPDYAFRVGGIRKFFLEAKRPLVNIKMGTTPAYQLRSYGWSCKLFLSVLSDFEEFAVYDCRFQPFATDSASTARIQYLQYTDYVDHWEEIADLFHRDRVWNGSIEQFAESKNSKKGTSEVDAVFLKEIEQWREILAKDLAKNNPELSVQDLNYAVQITIDRILFLRMAESRGIEPEDQLKNLIDSANIYQNLCRIYHRADEKYNSGFFHFESEEDQPEKPDTLTLGLSFSNKSFHDIFKRLYFPLSPYRFDVLPVEILGNVYEQFLGKVIRLTPTRQVKVEEKPEVRKAGGVYYTPGYIVDSVVENTVGRLCDGKTPAEVAKLKIIDPACGSGSFLLGAYQYLKKWHLNYYIDLYKRTGKIPKVPKNHDEEDHIDLQYRRKKRKKSERSPYVIIEISKNNWILSQAEKRRILLNNIFGVDIDAQAVEVTKLSLSLAVLEGAHLESLDCERRLFYERALPNLALNIRCGNSLVAPDFYQKNPILFADFDEQLRINAFDWTDRDLGFGKIMDQGGFDAVIGNPPWGQKECKFSTEEKRYFEIHYPTASVGILDFFRLFVEKSISLLNSTGVWGQVLPDIVLLKDYESTRSYILNHIHLQNINHWGTAFAKVNMDACTLIGTKSKFRKRIRISVFQNGNKVVNNELSQSVFAQLPDCKFNLFLTNESWKLISKLNGLQKFSEFFQTHEGIHSGNVRSKLFVDSPLNENCKKLIFGRDEVKRYFLNWKGKWVHYSKSYFKKNDYAGLGKPEYFETPKLIIRRTGDYILACLDEEKYYFSNNLFVCIPNDSKVNLLFYLGILNSRLLSWYYRTMQPRVGRAFAEIKINLINDLPVPNMDLHNPKCSKCRDELIESVERILFLNRKLNVISNGGSALQNRIVLERQITALDHHIDDLVYDLYDLSEEERKMVNSSS
ncbi:MAG: TaqI-like C-terminal specificity domain-containing protein [Planctomycetia bacterium]|nr:TaqI-like C-terminal specificity domain-containing protein [Planctomycetia bacterium]